MTSPVAAARSVSDAAALWRVRPGFFNSCSYGPPPEPAWEALQDSLTAWRTGDGPWQPWAEAVDTSRAAFGRLFAIDPQHITTGAAVSQLLAPLGVALPDGARVLVPDIEFTSGVFPFAVHAARGVEVGTAPLADFAAAINASTTLVSVSAVQSATGEVADLASIAARCREVGAILHVDATQAAGWLPLQALDVDFLSVGAYKWLCAPRGTAALTIHPDLAERHPEFAQRLVPVAAGWYAAAPGAYYGMPLRLADGARAFDISPAWHSWVGTAPAIDVLLSASINAIYQHNVTLANEFRAGVGLAPSNSAIVSVALPDDALQRMQHADLQFTVMDGRARLAFHLYNTGADVAAALTAVGRG